MGKNAFLLYGDVTAFLTALMTVMNRAVKWIFIYHPTASPSEGMPLASGVNFHLSITSGMTTLMFQQVSFDGFQTKLSLIVVQTFGTLEGYGIQPS